MICFCLPKGSVIGPLVVAGVMIDEADEEKLRKIGVKDSKMLTPHQRERLFPLIKKIAKDYVALKVSAKEIDELMKIKNLNIIEAEKMAQIIKTLGADKAYVDAPQVSTEKFKMVLLNMAKNHTEIIAENYADVKYPVVSAASIIAKVERDREVEKLKKEVGFDFGVGYSHDSRSIEFVKKALKDGKHLEHIRHSWVTVDGLKSKKEQKSLKEYK
ncbi:ribonuclease HII [Candidatus Micrarchaeota archaeon RBG_16_36_9]|nr:MAG: ribonuclease HII [Candidatus Micrarchaeota archaeon RBG_16_36_9]